MSEVFDAFMVMFLFTGLGIIFVIGVIGLTEIVSDLFGWERCNDSRNRKD